MVLDNSCSPPKILCCHRRPFHKDIRLRVERQSHRYCGQGFRRVRRRELPYWETDRIRYELRGTTRRSHARD